MDVECKNMITVIVIVGAKLIEGLNSTTKGQ